MSTSKFPLGLLIAVVMAAGVVGLFLSHTSAQQTRLIHLAQGWNSAAWTGEKQSASEALANLGDAVLIVYGYNNDSQSFTRHVVGRPEISTLTDFEPEQAYWVLAQRSADWSVPGPAVPSCPTVTPCPTGTPCPDCPPVTNLPSDLCTSYKISIETNEVVLEIAEAGKLVGSTASEVRARIDEDQRDFDQYCSGVPLAKPSLVALRCTIAGKWLGMEHTTMLYAPSAQDQVWANQFDSIIDKYCKP